jgi:transposase
MNPSIKSVGINAQIFSDLRDRFIRISPKGNTNVASNESNENEIKRLKKQALRLTQERDILKKAAAYFAQEIV